MNKNEWSVLKADKTRHNLKKWRPIILNYLRVHFKVVLGNRTRLFLLHWPTALLISSLMTIVVHLEVEVSRKYWVSYKTRDDSSKTEIKLWMALLTVTIYAHVKKKGDATWRCVVLFFISNPLPWKENIKSPSISR